jgi:GntR family transcriptional regulator, phosphonate transport system regulatory protein
MKRWEMVRASLLADIEAGTLRSGDRLPGDHELARRFEVNRHTVRNAISVLAEEGAIRVKHGVGSFVADDFISQKLSSDPQFTASAAAKDRQIRREILSIRETPADDEVAAILQIAKGDLITEVRKINWVDGRPLAVGTAYYPVARVPGLISAFEGSNSPTAALRRCGITKYRRKWTKIGARRANESEAERLQISVSSPVLTDSNLDVNTKGEPIKFGRIVVRSDRYEYLIEADSNPSFSE